MFWVYGYVLSQIYLVCASLSSLTGLLMAVLGTYSPHVAVQQFRQALFLIQQNLSGILSAFVSRPSLGTVTYRRMLGDMGLAFLETLCRQVLSLLSNLDPYTNFAKSTMCGVLTISFMFVLRYRNDMKRLRNVSLMQQRTIRHLAQARDIRNFRTEALGAEVTRMCAEQDRLDSLRAKELDALYKELDSIEVRLNASP